MLILLVGVSMYIRIVDRNDHARPHPHNCKKQHTFLLLPQPNQQTLIIPRSEIQIQARVHQRLAAISPIESIARVPRVALQTLHFERWRRGFDRSVLLES
jgi:hypothetical protein